MALKIPDSMDECMYFTRRADGKLKIMAWVYKPICPKCGQGKLGKPVDAKTGKVKIRADIHECPACHAQFTEEEAIQGLNIEVIYTCPYCGNEGETTTAYKRKNWEGVPSYIFTCQKCGKTIGITKKMKAPKKKGVPDLDE